MCAARPSDFPHTYDRDYYASLKAEYAHEPNVHIYAKDDYALDPHVPPWLSDGMPVDVAATRARVRASPRAPRELDLDAPERLWRVSDLHSDQEQRQFLATCRNADPVSGRVWRDPMPESDFQHDPHLDWIHLRRFDDGPRAARDAEDALRDAQPKPLPRTKTYHTEEDEFQAVLESANRMQTDHLDDPSPITEWDHLVPPPSDAELDRWSKAAKERGGNATAHESYFLSPTASREPAPAPSGAVPPQRDSLLAAHHAEWEGDVRVFSIGKDGAVEEGDAARVTSVTKGAAGGVQWGTVVVMDGVEVVSEAAFEPLKYPDDLVSGRAVGPDGSYVQIAAKEGGGVYAGVSVGDGFLKRLTGVACRAAMELCLVEGARRDRVVLCTGEDGLRFERVVVLSERKAGGGAGEARSAVAAVSVEALRGEWAGAGLVLLPEFPPFPSKLVQTRGRFAAVDGATEDQVSWVEHETADPPDAESKRRLRTVSKKKVSRRVAAARAHDRRRLARCDALWRDAVDGRVETHAWRMTRAPQGVTGMASPRLGNFVVDYGAVALPGGLLVTMPVGKASPGMWNTVSLMQSSRPTRKRVTAGRNEEGGLVGALFVTERVEQEELADEAAAYV